MTTYGPARKSRRVPCPGVGQPARSPELGIGGCPVCECYVSARKDGTTGAHTTTPRKAAQHLRPAKETR